MRPVDYGLEGIYYGLEKVYLFPFFDHLFLGVVSKFIHAAGGVRVIIDN